MLPKNVSKGLKVAGEVGLGILLIIRGKSIMFIISAVFNFTTSVIIIMEGQKCGKGGNEEHMFPTY